LSVITGAAVDEASVEVMRRASLVVFVVIDTVVPSSVIKLSVTVLESLHFVIVLAVPDPSTNEDPQTRESISSVTIEEPL